MAKSIQDIVTEVRFILQDEDEDGIYRNSDESIVRVVNSTMYELKRVRPDVWLGGYNAPLPEYEVGALDVPIPFDAMFFQATIFYIVGFIELQDDEFAVDGRAAGLLRAFGAMLTSAA